MTEIERSLLAQYHKQLKLVKIWRAVARRNATWVAFIIQHERNHAMMQGHLSCNVCGYPRYLDNDGETDP